MPPDLRQAAGTFGKCMVCEGDCFFESKQCNKVRPAGRCIVPYKLLEALQKFSIGFLAE